jgi:hypothetical protein
MDLRRNERDTHVHFEMSECMDLILPVESGEDQVGLCSESTVDYASRAKIIGFYVGFGS